MHNNLFRKANTLLGWLVFVISGVVYLLTLEPSVSFWDCGEFIAASYKLQIGHPPGAPFFLITQRIMSLLAPSADLAARFMNAFSALASGATIMFLFWTITILAQKIVPDNQSNRISLSEIIILASGLIGSLTFAFTDTFWFSAVETEVYAYSSLFTAVVFWAILKWEAVAGQPRADRWIILIAYLMGLSLGVHLLNLLAIPAIALVWYYKTHKPTLKGILVTLLISFVLIAFIMWGIIQGTARFAIYIEVFFVNVLHLPYNSGLLFFIVLVLSLCTALTIYAHKTGKAMLQLAMVSLALLYIGFGSYAIISIRSGANPPMDQNNPDDAVSLMNYLNRQQYGETPIIFGYYYNAPAVGYEKGKPTYYAKGGKYIKTEGEKRYRFDDRFKTFFPRMYSSQDAHESAYKSWGKIKGHQVSINGRNETIPTFSENLRFFFTYQLDHMYTRYFMWNFSGRQNDIQGYGDPLNGNWLTGIGFIDKARLGHNGKQPASMANPKTTNRYFMLPFLLGLAGLIFQYSKRNRDFLAVLLLFFMTGIAIVIFLNQTPYQPRERDYAYAGSFYAYAIWIGLGVTALSHWLERIFAPKQALIVTIVISLMIPVLVFSQNYDDHDRSGRYIARETGKNYLRSCEKDAILFTYGDNDTFPLWYAQDVEGFRPDIHICNVTLLSAAWYIDQMKQKVYQSDPLPIKMPNDKYEQNNRNIVLIQEAIDRPVELSQMLSLALSDDSRAKVSTQDGEQYSFLPSRKVKITVDKARVLASGTVSQKDADLIEDSIIFELKGRYISKNELAILDVLANNNWERPVYFDLSVVQTSNIKLERYLQNEGFAFRFVPILNPTQNMGRIDSDLLYRRLMDEMAWGGTDNPEVLIDEGIQRTIEIVQVKPSFIRLADQLFKEGDTTRSVAVLDRMYSILPFGRFNTSSNDIYSASLYYRLDQPEKGDQVLSHVADECFEKIGFFLSMSPGYASTIKGETEKQGSTLKMVIEVARQAERNELVNTIEIRLKELMGNSVL